MPDMPFPHTHAVPALPGYDEAWLSAHGGFWTAREIAQQPDLLRRTQDLLGAQQTKIEAFLAPLLARPDLRIILTGAGTSAFIGDSLAPWLTARMQRPVESIATTDLACAPDLYFAKAAPTLLVSFGRSGNSPESLAVVDLADQCVSEIHHLVITCNADGELARFAEGHARGFGLLLPEETHDRSFAMTSSFSCMTYAALAMFSGIDAMPSRNAALSAAVAEVIETRLPFLQQVVAEDYDRVVYLGSHIFKGLAREAGLKLLELTNGGIATLFDSTLGFRHGPKTFVTGRTLVIIFVSNDPYTRQYDIDLLDELRRDGEAGRVIAVTAQDGLEAYDHIRIQGMEEAQDIDLIFPYIAVAQIFAFQQSLKRGLTPDQPNIKGTVNRVVQGVQIYKRT
ncbi:SIS domain-containing protein [Asticcacaulis sp. EMRT-3]|uniref:SIS domain-containing protein n=1 Tax=Asticcacaulis sp. EMRT-3 TaxID=3040349 RepID=UPI0024AF251A|nr:SIS domain-containing protein [Asticcacaulis sp. EMRT-3]MDI7775751.1 SIS domain-containing protein [Asticcacaulis sp. EMRT-3]